MQASLPVSTRATEGRSSDLPVRISSVDWRASNATQLMWIGEHPTQPIEEERRTFWAARADQKKELEEERRTAKRKYDADVQAQKVYNERVKGESRKKFKAANASHAQAEEASSVVGSSAATATIGAAAAARDPILQVAKDLVAASIAEVLSEYEDGMEIEDDGAEDA